MKITEKHLRNIISEAIAGALDEMNSEGKKTNNKSDYFGRHYQTVGSRDTDFSDIDMGPDISKPGNKYAREDDKNNWNGGYWPGDEKLSDLKHQMRGKGGYFDGIEDFEDGGEERLDNDPATKFDQASQKRALRSMRKHDEGVGYRDSGAAKAAAKCGIPMKVAYKLSNSTLNSILKDLGVKYKSEYRKNIK